MLLLFSVIFTFLVTHSSARVIRRSYGIDQGASVENVPEPSEPSGYYFPDNAPDITKGDYGSQQDIVSSTYDRSDQKQVTVSNQGTSSDWRPETPPPPPSDGDLPNREYFTLIPQTPDTDYPTPEWEGEEKTTKAPVTTTQRPWWETSTTTTTARPWWETTTQSPWYETSTIPSTTTTLPWWETSTTTQRPWWETTDRPLWETTTTAPTTTTQKPWWLTSTTTQRPWWETSTTAVPWWLTSTQQPGGYYRQRNQSRRPPPIRRLPIPRRSRGGCRILNPLVHGKSHPENDDSCVVDSVIQSGCSCRYLRGENDDRGCAQFFLTLCKRN